MIQTAELAAAKQKTTHASNTTHCQAGAGRDGFESIVGGLPRGSVRGNPHRHHHAPGFPPRTCAGMIFPPVDPAAARSTPAMSPPIVASHVEWSIGHRRP
jgi:hypothetical protein